MIIETGTNVTNADSYVSVSYADAYHTLFGNTLWSSKTNPEKEMALIHGTRSIELLYGQKYLSIPLYRVQSLLFPRFTFVINGSQVVDAGVIPKQLKDAVCEAALLYTSGANVYPTPNNGMKVKANKVKIGDIEISEEYSKSPEAEAFENFNKIDVILSPILKKASSSRIINF